MYTYDEWGNTMLHIQTGREGIKIFEEMGIKNPSKEEYEKHMASWRKIEAERSEQIWEWIRKTFDLPDTWNKD